MLTNPEDLPEMEYYTGGQDFGLNIAGVKIGYNKDMIYVVKDHGGHNIRTKTFNDQLTLKGWFENDKFIKINDHYMDAVRYAIFSPAQKGVVIRQDIGRIVLAFKLGY